MIRPIYVCGSARSGKDSLANCISKILFEDVESIKLSLATELKLELASLIKEQFGFSVFTEDTAQKELIRGILVEYGEAKRKISGGRYWMDKLEPKIKDALENSELPIIPDCRFKNEIEWAKSLNGILIYVTRFDSNNVKIPPANYKEEENDPYLVQNADYFVDWPTFGEDKERMMDIANIQLKEMIEEIKEKILI